MLYDASEVVSIIKDYGDIYERMCSSINGYEVGNIVVVECEILKIVLLWTGEQFKPEAPITKARQMYFKTWDNRLKVAYELPEYMRRATKQEEDKYYLMRFKNG